MSRTMVKLASAYLTAGRVQQLKEVALRGGATALHKQELHGGASWHLCVYAGVCVFVCGGQRHCISRSSMGGHHGTCVCVCVCAGVCIWVWGAHALHKQELHGGYHGTCLCVCAGVCVFECKCVLYMFEYVGRVFPATNRETVAL